jgi:transcriptional regulator with XRE-family HTH domain
MLRIVCGLIVCGHRFWSSVPGSRFIKNFGQRVRELREANGMSQERLADTARLHRTHVSLIERGMRSVRLETIERLAMALHVEPAKLMPKIESPRRL